VRNSCSDGAYHGGDFCLVGSQCESGNVGFREEPGTSALLQDDWLSPPSSRDRTFVEITCWRLKMCFRREYCWGKSLLGQKLRREYERRSCGRDLGAVSVTSGCPSVISARFLSRGLRKGRSRRGVMPFAGEILGVYRLFWGVYAGNSHLRAILASFVTLLSRVRCSRERR